MTAIPQSTSARLLSGRLTDPLRRVAQRHWYVLATVGVLKTLTFSLLALLAATLLLGYFDRLWMPVRIVLAAAAWATVLGSAVRFLRPALRRWSLGRAAMHVEAHSPALQERLSSAVELSADSDPACRGSDALIAHLVGQAEADAGAVRPEQIVRTDRVVRWSMLLIPVLLAWLVLVSLPGTTKTAMGGLYRVLMPWKGALPTLLTEVVVQPGDVTLVQGDAMDITARVSFEANRRDAGHAVLVRQFENGQKLTDDMETAAPGDYRIHFDDLQQGFKYKVVTDQGDSSLFSATVHPRPQIESIDVRCDYPAYTGLSATVVSGREGNVEAVVGTRVTFTVHTALPIVTDKSQIVVDEGTPDQLVLPLKQVAEGKPDYQAQLIVNHSGEYKINLTNEFDLTNKDEQPRSIVAQPDEVPTIVIRSPEPQISVRPDDTVPVRYEATDDFGVSKIEAVLQVDDHAPQTVAVPFKTEDKRTVNAPDFRLSVADALKAAGYIDSDRVDRVTYQLKVTDNRDPDPQFSYSARQTLKIDRHEDLSYQDKSEKKIADDLQRAIQKAIEQLNREQGEVQPAKDIDAKQHLEPWHQKQLHQATQDLPHTSRDLLKAAEEAKDTVFQDVAREVKKIATKPIRSAAEDATQADLNVDNGQDRKDAATRATAEIVDAREQLQKIIEKQEIQKDERAAEAARELAEAAKRQQEAAAIMKPQDQANQNQDPQQRQQQETAMRKQEQANQKLRQAMDNAEALRDPKAAETAQKLEDLIRKVEETQKQQDQAAEQTEKQQAATDIQQKANELAEKQEALNKDIAHANEQNKDAIQKAGVNPPNKDQQNNIVKALNKNELQQAHDQMKQAANQLHQEAQQLQNQARSNDLHPNSKQQEAMNKDQQAQQKSQDQKNREEQAANALKQAAQQNAAPKPDDAAVKNAEEAAKEIEKEAAGLHADNADAKHEAQAAQQDAQAAEKSADQAAHAANPQEAQKDLNDAAQQLNKAGAELADAAKKNADADKAQMTKAQQQDSQAAAEQADTQAQEQDALAKAIEGEQNDLAKVRQNQQSPDQNAQQENQVAEKANAEQQEAEQLQHQAMDAKNANVAHRAEQAKADLAQAHQHAAEAAKAEQHAAQHQQEAANAPDAAQAKAAEQNADRALEQAAQQQQHAQDALAKAENELRDLPGEMAQAQANPEQNGGEHPDAQNGQGEPPQQQAAQAAQEAAQAQQEASQQNPAAAQEAANALNQAAQAMAKAVPGLHQEDGQDPGQDPGEDPAHDPSRALESKEGIAAANGAPIVLPASVRDIGITADQWAKLPDLAKKDLMNAAQQSGPAAYRQMIKDYYVRVAKLQRSGAANAQ
jgi:hypothetical protein